MSNPYFSFKQFIVHHDLCAMKVGTDGVLLGAWADCLEADRILDIGTGSGLIALMLAQRSSVRIDAIEIDENAYKQADKNFKNSKFASLLTVYHSDILNYSPNSQYDLIVSNPPYFSNALQSQDKARNLARHSDSLSLNLLIQTAKKLLSKSGRLCLILPASSYEDACCIASENKLFLTKKCFVRPQQDDLPKRVLLEFSIKYTPVREEELFIEKSRHIYSEAYIKLTKDFYLNFS